MDAETTASYQDAGFGRSTAFGSAPAVVVVDMCAAYFEPSSPLFIDRPEVAEAVGRVIELARHRDLPVLWTRVEYEPGGADGGVWYSKVPVLSSFDRGNPLGQWLPGLEPADGDVVVTKQHASGFYGTDLAEHLRRLEVDSVIVVGVSTSGCVRATATDTSANGFRPFVVREAVGDRTAAVHDANLFDLQAKYADVVDENELTGALDDLAN